MNSDATDSGPERNLLFVQTLPVHGVDITRMHWRELSTTMNTAARYARDGAHWTCVTTEYQTAGRGTHGRTWLASPGASLMISLVLPPPVVMEGLETLSVETADVLRDVLRGYAEGDYAIKHPNDLLIDGKKCAGILYESAVCDGAMTSLVLGMGVNLTQSAEDFATAGWPDAVSVLAAPGRAPGPEPLLRDFLDAFIPFYRARTNVVTQSAATGRL